MAAHAVVLCPPCFPVCVWCCLCLLSGNALDEDAESFLDAGANRILSKPVQRAALEAVLTRYLPGWMTTASIAQQKINRDRQHREHA